MYGLSRAIFTIKWELSSCNGDHMALKAERLLSGPFQKFANLSCSERTQCPTAGEGRRSTPYSRANKFSALFCFLCCSANSQLCPRRHGRSKPQITRRHLWLSLDANRSRPSPSASPSSFTLLMMRDLGWRGDAPTLPEYPSTTPLTARWGGKGKLREDSFVAGGQTRRGLHRLPQ